MQEKLKKNSKLVSFNVTSLYANLSHELGLKAIEYWLDKHPEMIHLDLKIFFSRSIKAF